MAKTLEIVHPHACGIDIGIKHFYVDAVGIFHDFNFLVLKLSNLKIMV